AYAHHTRTDSHAPPHSDQPHSARRAESFLLVPPAQCSPAHRSSSRARRRSPRRSIVAATSLRIGPHSPAFPSCRERPAQNPLSEAPCSHSPLPFLLSYY